MEWNSLAPDWPREAPAAAGDAANGRRRCKNITQTQLELTAVISGRRMENTGLSRLSWGAQRLLRRFCYGRSKAENHCSGRGGGNPPGCHNRNGIGLPISNFTDKSFSLSRAFSKKRTPLPNLTGQVPRQHGRGWWLSSSINFKPKRGRHFYLPEFPKAIQMLRIYPRYLLRNTVYL